MQVEEEGDDEVELTIDDRNDIVNEQIERVQQETKEVLVWAESKGKLRCTIVSSVGFEERRS